MLFQLTPPIQRATTNVDFITLGVDISTHAPYTEGDARFSFVLFVSQNFNSRPLYRGRRHGPAFCKSFGYFNSRPLYRGRLVSISVWYRLKYFNSRPLYRGRHCNQLVLFHYSIFQLTPPIQRATGKFSDCHKAIPVFQLTPPIQRATAAFSPCVFSISFQLTPPIQRATVQF